MTPQELTKQRVSLGITLLNEKKPLWYHFIDIPRIKINNCHRCILGQLYGGFIAGVLRLFPGIDEAVEVEHGFIADSYHGVTYDMLTREWKERITELQGVQDA